MAGSIAKHRMLLGPSRWKGPRHSPVPMWISDHYPEGWTQAGSRSPGPLDVRVALAQHLVANGVKTLVMEREKPHSGEDDISLFARLSAGTDAWMYYLPLGGRQGGRDFEVGWLANSLERGEIQLDQLPILAEAGVLEWNVEEDRMIVAEKGNRHRYLSALVARQPPILRWSDYRTLFAKALRFGKDLLLE